MVKSSLLFVVHCPLGLVACLGLENIWLSVGKCSGHLVMPDGVIWLRTRRSLKPSLLVNLCLGELHPFHEEEEEEVERWLSGCGRVKLDGSPLAQPASPLGPSWQREPQTGLPGDVEGWPGSIWGAEPGGAPPPPPLQPSCFLRSGCLRALA